MTNIIRPTFGSRIPRPEAGAPAAEEYRLLHIYGRAAGYVVALIEDASGPEGAVLKVVVAPEGANAVGAVAVMPATPEGRIDADATAMAILRTLEIVEASLGPKPA